MLHIFYGCFLPLRKLLQVSYCHYYYCIVFTVLLRDWESLLFIIEAEWVMDKTIFGDPVGIGRDYACYAPNRTDCPSVGFRGCEETYFLWNLWLELFPSKCLGKWNVLQESESATVGNVNTSYIFAFKYIPYTEHVTFGAVTVLSYPTLFYQFFHTLKMPWLSTRTEGNNVRVTCDPKYLQGHEIREDRN